MWYSAPFSRQQIYERLRYLELSKDLRTIFQYNNLMFLTAGVLAGRRLGSTWEDAVQARMFRPLGMASSNMSVEDSRRSADFALPYKQKDEQPQEVPFRNIDAIGPAGSVNSNAEDMARWLMLNLGKGKFEGKQVLSENQVEQMQTTQMPIAGQGRREELGPASYGMGWFLTTYRGRKLVHHGGNIDGFSALVTFMPRERLGLVILTNMNGSPMPTVVSYNGFDRLLGLDPIDWTGRLRDDEKKQKAAEAEAKAKNYTPRREGTRTSHELAAYAGRYEHPGYGAVDVAVEGSGLRVGIHSLSSEFKHFHYDVFQASEDPLNPISQQKLQFWTSLDGDIASLALPLEPSLGEIVFRRAASGQARSKAFLEPMTGDYVIGPVTATVAMRGDDTLTLFVPGQPKYELVPLDGTRFRLKEVNGFSVEFKKSEAGYAEVVFYQPNGTFVAKRKQN
jgi:CubicO group peptidase (beta-lactamase class C family)